jgi:hypothetical protein
MAIHYAFDTLFMLSPYGIYNYYYNNIKSRDYQECFI